MAVDFLILDWRCYFNCKYAAEGLAFGNSVYWIRFDEEFSEKVDLSLFATTWSLIFHVFVVFLE